MDDQNRTFSFRTDDRYRRFDRLFGVDPSRATVTLDDYGLTARFGWWSVRTTWDNIAGATVTGPYSVLRTIGPPRLGLRHRDLTFASTDSGGVEIRFHEPVRGIEALGLLRHPALTVTVDDPEALAMAIDERRRGASSDAVSDDSATPAAAPPATPEARQEEEAGDDLHTMTASQLRSLADERGVRHRSSMNKSDLVALLEADMGDDLVETMEEVTADDG